MDAEFWGQAGSLAMLQDVFVQLLNLGLSSWDHSVAVVALGSCALGLRTTLAIWCKGFCANVSSLPSTSMTLHWRISAVRCLLITFFSIAARRRHLRDA
jgi:hypothetical protein